MFGMSQICPGVTVSVSTVNSTVIILKVEILKNIKVPATCNCFGVKQCKQLFSQSSMVFQAILYDMLQLNNKEQTMRFRLNDVMEETDYCTQAILAALIVLHKQIYNNCKIQ